MLTTLVIVSAGTTAVLLTYAGLRARSRAPMLAERFQRYNTEPDALPTGKTFWESWQNFLVRPIAPIVEKLVPGYYLEQMHAQLRMAGLYANSHFQVFLAMIALGTLVGVLAGLVFGGRMAIPWAAALGAVGMILPTVILRQMVAKRQAAINDVLSDSMDLLTASVEAGLGLDAAIAQLVRRQSPQCAAINSELSRYLQELQLGTARSDALRGLGLRTGVEDLRHVVTALVHGDALGVGVSSILRAQAQHLRQRRKQRAEEQAMKAPIKILFPLLFGIFPSIFVLVLGPAVLRLMDSFIGKFS